MKPEISIIVPTLNEENYIEKCLKAIKNQDYKSYELIVVDGKSKDRTLKIAKKYTDKIFITEKGLGSQENYAAKKATGRYLLFIQADTILGKGVFKKFAKFLMESPEIVYGNLKFFYEDKGIRDRILRIAMAFYWNLSKILPLKWTHGPTLFARKDIFEKCGGFNTKKILLEDFEIGLRLKKFGKYGIVDNVRIISSSRRFVKKGYFKMLVEWIFWFIVLKLDIERKTDYWTFNQKDHK